MTKTIRRSDERNQELWRQAEEMWPRAVCTRCAAAVWRHWEERRNATQHRGLVDLCSGVKAAEVAAEYERLVATEVARALDGPPVGETMFWLNPGAPNTPLKFAAQLASKVQFGFSGFQFNKATIVRTRYAPGIDPAEPWNAPLIRTWDRGGFVDVPFVPGTAPLLDEVWGWEREAVRRYMAPKIVKPPPRIVGGVPPEFQSSWMRGWLSGVADAPLVEGGTWCDVAKWLNERAAPPKPLIEVVHELPPRLVGFRSGVVLYA